MALLKPDKGKKLVFAKNTIYKGESCKIGQDIPDIDDLTSHFIDKMYRAGIFAHPDDRRLFKYEQYINSNDVVQDDSTDVVNEKKEEKVEKEVVETLDDTAKVVVDTEESFQVEYQGKVGEIKRNQLREDGTLTSGGLKAFKD